MNLIISRSSDPSRFFTDRRAFLRAFGLGAGMSVVPTALAETLALTPPQTEGPFYPDKLPLDTDNDLVLINEAEKSAVGEITFLHGRVVNPAGDPIRDAVVEIWQCDATGMYLHSGSDGDKAKRDAGFQGFGRCITGAGGEYVFRTIKPVPYPGRTPHIHVAVKMRGTPRWTTQCYIKGHAQNDTDGIWRSLGDKAKLVTCEFTPMKGRKSGELAAEFPIVLGITPKE